VPAKDVQGLYEGMQKFMELDIQQQRAMGARGREKAELEFGEHKIADEIYGIVKIASDEI